MKDKNENQLEKTNPPRTEPARDVREYIPATDIYEKDDVILVRCDVPGVAEGEVDIRLDNTELEITAMQAAGNVEGLDLLEGEYETGVFRRTFSIPQLIDRNGIKARLHNGVLNIELPKSEQAKPRKIEIATGG